jgi:Flp pilus assembly protein TadB
MSDAPRSGEAYAKACRMFGKASPDPQRDGRQDMEIETLRNDIRAAETDYTARRLASAGTAELDRADAGIARKRKSLERAIRVREQRDFKRAMRITGMGLRVEEVVRFSSVMALLSVFVGLAIAIALSSGFGLEPMMAILAATGCAIALPLFVFMALINYPEKLARSLEMEAFGSAPEVINYMVMSMELSPSVDRAVLFAAENAEGPMADELRSLLWKVQSREFASIEEALMSYANELEGANEELRSAIYNILSASKETEREKMRSSLRRAGDSVLVGTRQRVEGFAASLATPATVLFSLGILLPMIIGSMLPMISMGGFTTGAEADAPRNEGWGNVFWLSVLVMNIVFPMIAVVYARSILEKRPGIHTMAQPDRGRRSGRYAVAFIALSLFAASAIITGTYLEFWGMQWSIAALVAVLGISAVGWCLLAWNTPVGRMKELQRLEDQMPDMLFQLGSRLGEGLALERALEDVSRTMRDTEMGKFLAEVLSRLRRSGAGISDVLFSGSFGLMPRHPSRKLRAAMRLVVEAAAKDAETAGNILITMSNHMRDLANSDKEMRLKLRSTIDSMKNTAILFAPVIMGVTVGLYALLSQTFGEMNGAETMPTPYFILVIGVYLLMTVTTIMYFSSGIEHGRGRWKRDTGMALPVAAVIFCVCSLGALLAFG